MLKKLNELKELHAKTTQGELRIERRDYESGDFNFIVYSDVNDFAWCLEELDPKAKKNAEFIVEAHKYLPRLVAALETCIQALTYYVETRDESKFIAIHSNFKSKDYAERTLKELEQILKGE